MRSRQQDIERFYDLLGMLERQSGGTRTLASCHGRMGWPKRGVYFFFEDGETRSGSGNGPRCVRVGTHALKLNAGTKLWGRLSQHRGSGRTGGGNHRSSIFRQIVGAALMARDAAHDCPDWNDRKPVDRTAVLLTERALERQVSAVIGAMPFLWLAIGDDPGPDSLRGYIERNAIALLSAWGKEPIDPPSKNWLGHYCDRARVGGSGLWNFNHVDERYDPAFLDQLEELIAQSQIT